jgi:hypothetical protein
MASLVQSSTVSSEVLVIDEEVEAAGGSGLFRFVRAVPAWLISMLVHVAILLVLGLISIADPVKVVNILTASSVAEDGPEIQEFAIEEMTVREMSESEEISEPVPEMSESMETLEPVEVAPMEMAEFAMEMPDMAGSLASQTSPLQTLTQMMVQPLDSRSASTKKRLLRAYGGTANSEAAVTNALKWLARHQLPNGGWTFQHNLVCNGACGNPGEPRQAQRVNSATAMALLPFMGAGQTHFNGDYRSVVYRGLRFLIQNGKNGMRNGVPVLDFTKASGNMYDQGLATIALCEAYAMTEDPELLVPAQAAVNFVAMAQCSDGGWYYQPRQRDGGDTSVTGWQVMALKSAHMGHLQVPLQSVQGSVLFLDKVGSDEGDIYGYRSRIKNATNRPGCVAVGLLCRMYTGWDKTHPGIVKGVEHLSKIGVDKRDIYYNYYAAQVLRHFGGIHWDKFNVVLRDWLVETQAQGSGDKGSWFFPNSKSHRGPLEGGRLASTAFAAMILEVYYRHMPLYAEGAAEEDFPL